jgi:hypothetical protein
MTVSRNIGRGGKRENSGRKRKPVAPPLKNIPASKGRTTQAQQDIDLARATLRHIAVNGENESARVSAARQLLEHATGKKAAQSTPDDDSDGWGDLIGRQSSGRVN